MLGALVIATPTLWLAMALLAAPTANQVPSAPAAAVPSPPRARSATAEETAGLSFAAASPSAAPSAAPSPAPSAAPSPSPSPSSRPSSRRRIFAPPGSRGARRGLSWSRADEPVPERRFLLGVEGVVVQAPPLRPEIVRFDPRFLGRSVSLGGLGLLGRLQVHPRIALEAVVRSGSVRYAGREDDEGPVVSQDQVMGDLGVLLYVARGDITQLAFDAGLGGMGTRVVYELDREGTQLFGSGLVRVGADAEFLFKRIAFVLSVRSYGVFTDRERVSNRGPLLEGKTLGAPVPTLQTFLVGSAGVAYRF
jgi:hypothetical protein